MKVFMMSLGLTALGLAGFGVGARQPAAEPVVPSTTERPVVSTMMVPLACMGCIDSKAWTPAGGDTGLVSSCGCNVELRFNPWGETPGLCTGTVPVCFSDPCGFAWTVQYRTDCATAVINGTECGTALSQLVVTNNYPNWSTAYNTNFSLSCGQRCTATYTMAQKNGMLICVDKATLTAKVGCSTCQ